MSTGGGMPAFGSLARSRVHSSAQCWFMKPTCGDDGSHSPDIAQRAHLGDGEGEGEGEGECEGEG